MNFARWFIQLAAMPAFLALAFVSYLQPSPLCTVPGFYGFLSSMWFMYVAMAAVHSCAWFPLVARLFSKSPSKPMPQLDCCAPLLSETTSGKI